MHRRSLGEVGEASRLETEKQTYRDTKHTGQRPWDLEHQSRGVLGMVGWPIFYYTGLLRFPPWRAREGGLPRTNKRGLLGGVPPKFKRGADMCVIEGDAARRTSGHGVGNLCLPLCALFVFVHWSFPRKVPCQSSKFSLAEPRGKETCLCLCRKQCSEASQRQRGEAY